MPYLFGRYKGRVPQGAIAAMYKGNIVLERLLGNQLAGFRVPNPAPHRFRRSCDERGAPSVER